MSRKSVRKYTDRKLSKDELDVIVRAGQQAPFASQLYSVLYSTEGPIAFHAPIWFVICVDAYKVERFMKLRGWDIVTNDLTLLLPGMQDAAYMAQNMVMAAFTAKDPTDREAFTAHWNKIMTDVTVILKTVVCDRQVVGSVLSYEEAGKAEVSYWIGKAYWGRGIATWALSEFLAHVNGTRPIYARIAKGNLGSRRVLQKCGFGIIGESKGFANARGKEIEELLLELEANERDEEQ